MTKIQCECGKFKAEIKNFPKDTPGRCICYCDDCQTYLHYLERTDLLDSAGGTEIIPVYPSNFKILEGKEVLRNLRISPKGPLRWYTSCCKTPIGNMQPQFPWFGTFNRPYLVNEPLYLEKALGPIRSRIQGRFAQGMTPKGTSAKMSFKDFRIIFPFLLKGFLTGKAKGSPFLDKDELTPVVKPQVLSLEERNQIRQKIGFPKK